ncbi:MAG: adenine-specific methyltransferase EcoRI family protein [Fibromonadaceae bacterium]|nr:adenine-specific methyltransferase EcoRI family protein [Fibromonadaceae bacterium]
MGNLNLHLASKAKKDEFYTQLPDIEREINHYKEHLKGKVIFCNCDDPELSNFWKYFHLNFEKLGIKKLISTHFVYEDIFKQGETYKLEYEGGNDNDIMVGVKTILIENGDFRSKECVEILKKSDIVITNPPFSLFREYVEQLVEYKRKFVIIGNVNSITYKEIFKLIKENKIWLGVSIHSGDREFKVPKDYPLKAAGYRIDNEGNHYIRVKGVRWFTNLDYKERHENLILYKKYNKKDYPKYDNYKAINVDVTKEIPMDYDGVMGVPITFLDKYNPQQFEIIGIDRYVEDNPNYGHRFKLNNKETYARLLIKKKEK